MSAKHRKSLNPRNGYPQIYFTFLGNVIVARLESIITPLPMPSETAATILKRLKYRADLICIDGSHELEGSLGDMRSYWELLTEDGVMFGDDYQDGWPGVKMAVRTFTNNLGRAPNMDGVHWIVPKREDWTLDDSQAGQQITPAGD